MGSTEETPEMESDDEEMDSDDEDTEETEEEETEEEEVEESVVYEIELSEDEEINEEATIKDSKIGATANGKPRTAKRDKTMGNESAAPNTGDIEGQKAPLDSDSGDNLDGGFDDKHNGKNGNHAEHVMEVIVMKTLKK